MVVAARALLFYFFVFLCTWEIGSIHRTSGLLLSYRTTIFLGCISGFVFMAYDVVSSYSFLSLR